MLHADKQTAETKTWGGISCSQAQCHNIVLVNSETYGYDGYVQWYVIDISSHFQEIDSLPFRKAWPSLSKRSSSWTCFVTLEVVACLRKGDWLWLHSFATIVCPLAARICGAGSHTCAWEPRQFCLGARFFWKSWKTVACWENISFFSSCAWRFQLIFDAAQQDHVRAELALGMLGCMSAKNEGLMRQKVWSIHSWQSSLSKEYADPWWGLWKRWRYRLQLRADGCRGFHCQWSGVVHLQYLPKSDWFVKGWPPMTTMSYFQCFPCWGQLSTSAVCNGKDLHEWFASRGTGLVSLNFPSEWLQRI